MGRDVEDIELARLSRGLEDIQNKDVEFENAALASRSPKQRV